MASRESYLLPLRIISDTFIVKLLIVSWRLSTLPCFYPYIIPHTPSTPPPCLFLILLEYKSFTLCHHELEVTVARIWV